MISNRPVFRLYLALGNRVSRKLAKVQSKVNCIKGTDQPAAGHEDIFDRMYLLERQLDLSIKEEDFASAALLKRSLDKLEKGLGSTGSLLLGLLKQLQTDDPASLTSAVRNLADLGHLDAVPYLLSLMSTYKDNNNQVMADLETACWNIFMHPPSPEAGELMQKACKLMERRDQWDNCYLVIEKLCKLEPSWPEVWNKKATILYLLHRYQESIDACDITLQLNPYHFGAAAGEGMCRYAMMDLGGAIAAFQRAMDINPSMTRLERTIERLKLQLKEDAN
jgi:tetratricopeptide (TPR) repeat protein